MTGIIVLETASLAFRNNLAEIDLRGPLSEFSALGLEKLFWAVICG
jgi:hypothetical protein